LIAIDLIDSIFARRSWGAAEANVRGITPDQLKYLRDLIQRDPEGHKVRAGAPGSLVWTPSGPHRYIVTEDPTGGEKHTLTRLSNISAGPSLFDL
jgi:hypothetical protein